jgi:SAM-dependent methyltransferase
MDNERDNQSIYSRMVEKYANDDTPWTHHELPPPEVQEIVERLSPGRALDLGCGHGRASRYLAQRGWQVDGVDFVPQAIAEAKSLSAQAGLAEAINFWVGDITQLTMLTGPYDLVLDVGCAHSLDAEDWQMHYQELARLVRPGGVYLHYSRLQVEAGGWGLDDQAYQNLMHKGFRLTAVTYGLTVMSSTEQWPSVWFEWARCKS